MFGAGCAMTSPRGRQEFSSPHSHLHFSRQTILPRIAFCRLPSGRCDVESTKDSHRKKAGRPPYAVWRQFPALGDPAARERPGNRFLFPIS